jgi:effector-binding domain-containing protein
MTTAALHVEAGTALVAELLARLERLGRAPIGPVLCLLPRADGESLVLQMCTAIADPPPGERVLTLPPTIVAATEHVGPYEEIGLADLALHAFAEEHGLVASGAVREVYRNDPAVVPPDALATDVLLPVTRPSDRTRGTAAASR